MQYCPKCRINIRGNKARCPLCQGHLEGMPENAAFPSLRKPGISARSIVKMSTFCFLTIEIIMCAIWFLTSYNYHTTLPWVPLVIAGAAVLWLDLLIALYMRYNVLKIFTTEAYIAIILDVIIDLETGSHGWSVTWMIPCTFAALAIATVIFETISRMSLVEYIIYLLADTVFCMVQIWPIAAHFNHFVWPAIICMTAYMIFAFWIIVFKTKDIRNASAKYFNI